MSRRRLGPALLLVSFSFGLVATGACSTSSSSSGDGAGAAAGSGGGAGSPATGGAVETGGSGGATIPGFDLAAAETACVDYVVAQCSRRVACDPSNPSGYAECFAVQEQCPARFLSPGSGYTAESLAACATQWAELSCDAVNARETPACVSAGTRAAGEPCRVAAQCASKICSAPDASVCGVCLDAAESGGACEVQAQCPAHELCSFGTCRQLQVWAPELQLSDGSPCTYDGACAGVCAQTAEGDRCVPAPTIGQACATVSVAGARRCAWLLHCSPGGLCEPAGEAGQPCAEGVEPCTGSYCDSATGFAPGTCTDWLDPGSVCDPAVVEACGEHDFCTCDDAGCTTAHCVRYTDAGLACDEYTRCTGGSACVSGTCTDVTAPYWPDDCPG